MRAVVPARRAITGLGAPTSAGLAIAALFVAACSKPKDPKGEPTAGNWRPIVLPSADAIRLPPPPARGSTEERAEIEELLSHQARRTEADLARVRFWNLGTCVHWNEIARDLVAKHRAPHTMASRVYALLSVGQYDALIAAFNNKYFYKRRPPDSLERSVSPVIPYLGDPVYPSGPATIAAVSAAVLTHLYPDESAFLEAKVQDLHRSRLQAGIGFPSDLKAGDALGRQVAAAIIRYAESDGAKSRALAAPTSTPGHWESTGPKRPLDPRWGEVRPWLMSKGSQFLPPPPPSEGSPAYREALAEVKTLSSNPTLEQQRLAALWADGLGSYAPAGRWNATAASLIRKHKFSEIRAARVFALLNIALMDAGISAWNSKYHYLSRRPSQADPEIVTHIGEPNSPSYTCSHAAFSGAGAGVLGYLFPDDRQWLAAKAEEAAMSRVFAGIQFRFEGEAGLAGGRAVADLAIQRAQADGAPEFLRNDP